MKLHPEDPRITAFLLGELSDADAELVASAIDADPSLRSVRDELSATRDILVAALEPGNHRLDATARESILSAARDAEKSGATPRFTIVRNALIPAAAAAGVALVGLLTWGQLRDKPAPAPVSGTAGETTRSAPAADPSPFPAVAGLATFRAPADGLPLNLPVIGLRSAIPSIARSVRELHRMPDPSEIRIGSLLNSFPLRPAGPTVVTRFPVNHWHPDHRTPSVTTHAATLATETIRCPWKPSSVIVLVSLGGNPRVDCDLTSAFLPRSENVRRFRLLENTVADAADAPSPGARLRAGESSLLAIEIEPVDPHAPLGEITWSINDRPANPVPVAFDPDREASPDARFAALLCSFGLWAASPQGQPVDAHVVAALAREVATEELSAERADFLILVDQALDL